MGTAAAAMTAIAAGSPSRSRPPPAVRAGFVAARTPRAIARRHRLGGREADPGDVGRQPHREANSASPSIAMCGGDSARAKPSIPSEATFAASALSAARWWRRRRWSCGRARRTARARLRPPASAARSRRAGGRRPRRGRRRSARRCRDRARRRRAFTATSAPTTTSPSRRRGAAEPAAHRARDTVDLAHARARARAHVALGHRPGRGAGRRLVAHLAVGRAAPSPTLRSKRNAPGTCGTTVGPAGEAPPALLEPAHARPRSPRRRSGCRRRGRRRPRSARGGGDRGSRDRRRRCAAAQLDAADGGRVAQHHA